MSNNWYEFEPRSGINTYELAQIIQALMMIAVDDNLMGRLPKECRDHFKKVTEEEMHAKRKFAMEGK